MKAEVIKKKTQKERLEELEAGYKYLINNFNIFAETTNGFIEDVYKELNKSKQNALDTNRRVTDEIEYFDKRLRKIHDMVSNLRDINPVVNVVDIRERNDKDKEDVV